MSDQDDGNNPTSERDNTSNQPEKNGEQGGDQGKIHGSQIVGNPGSAGAGGSGGQGGGSQGGGGQGNLKG